MIRQKCVHWSYITLIEYSFDKTDIKVSVYSFLQYMSDVNQYRTLYNQNPTDYGNYVPHYKLHTQLKCPI